MNLEEKNVELEEESSIDIWEIIGVLKNKLSWIVAAALFGAVIAYAISAFLIKPTYTAQVIMYVNNRKSNTYTEAINRNQLTAVAELVPTYQSIVNTKSAMKRAIDDGGISGYTPDQLLSMVSTQMIEDTGIFAITVRGEAQFDVAEIANAIAQNGTKEISKYIEGTTATIIDYAVDPVQKSSPSNKRNALIGFLLGAILSSAIVLAIYFLDTRLKKSDDFVMAMNAPVLGMIQNMDVRVDDTAEKGTDSKKTKKAGGKR